MANNAKSKNRPVLLEPEEMHRDIKFLLEQVSIMEHAQDREGIAAIRKKYRLKASWE
jgi:hypothetical protein